MLIIGHRGAKGLAPDNTIAGFEAALKHGVDGIEFDVRVTSDDVPILIHDAFILPEQNRGKVVRDTTFEELKLLRPDLVTLEEALEFLHNKTLLMIEIKPGEDTEPIIAVLKSRLQSGLKPEHIWIASFQYKILKKMKKAFPELTYVVLETWFSIRGIDRAVWLGTKFIASDHRWISGISLLSINSSYKKIAYTMNDPAKAKKWERNGLYAVITDYPDRFTQKS